MIAYKIDPFADTIELVEASGLDDYYREIGCECIDISVVTIGGVPFNVVCDDEALLRESVAPSVLDGNGRPILWNTVIVFGFDDDADLRSLTLDECLTIAERICRVTDRGSKDGWYTLVAD